MRVIVTGGAGFIGSALVRHLVSLDSVEVLNLDKLTYSGNLSSLDLVADSPRYRFARLDIVDKNAVLQVLTDFQPDGIMHLAAESHVDRSIDSPDVFIETNVVGTLSLLQGCLSYWESLNADRKKNFRFLHVSTDEVFGDLGETNGFFTETTPYSPSSPYAASKAASDHLVRAWARTYGIPVLVTNCSNNYGPYQFPEKLIPHMILNAVSGKELPVYGDGTQIRDWLYVEDHVRALWQVLREGQVGDTYNIGGHNEVRNIDVVRMICDQLQRRLSPAQPFSELITFVKDRPGHDRRYAIDATHIKRELGWTPEETFESGISNTVDWYLANRKWWQEILDGTYRLNRTGIRSNAVG